MITALAAPIVDRFALPILRLVFFHLSLPQSGLFIGIHTVFSLLKVAPVAEENISEHLSKVSIFELVLILEMRSTYSVADRLSFYIVLEFWYLSNVGLDSILKSPKTISATISSSAMLSL